MIRNDGKEIPVTTHIFADNGETDKLLALAHFLWVNDTGSHQPVRELLDVWAYHAFLKLLLCSAVEAIRARVVKKDFEIMHLRSLRCIAE